MPDLVTIEEVTEQLAALARNGYSEQARSQASQWATPFLIAASDPVQPEALGEALFLLGAADLRGDLTGGFVYQPVDFEAAAKALDEP